MAGMSGPIRLTSLDNPRIKALVRLREHRHRRRSGLFLAEGLREISRALACGLTLHELYVCSDMFTAPLPLGASKPLRFEVTRQVLGKIAYNENPEGVIAVVEQPRWSLEALMEAPRDPGWPDLWLIAAGTEKPGNLGAMVRSAEAAGARGVLVADAVVDAFNPNTIRSSTGAVFSLPVVEVTRDQVIDLCRQRGVRIVAATLEGRRRHSDAPMTGPTALLIGPEDRGLDAPWLSLVQGTGGDLVRIPMPGRLVDSLNASNAAAILLFEVVRQRDVPLTPVSNNR